MSFTKTVVLGAVVVAGGLLTAVPGRAAESPPAPPAPSYSPSISDDGGTIAFASRAGGPGDANDTDDVFVRTGRKSPVRASVGPDGAEGDGSSFAPALSPDGGFVAFESEAATLAPGDTNGFGDVFLHERSTGATTLLSRAPGGAPADGPSFGPSPARGGAQVAFSSEATNLVAGDTNNAEDVFVWDPALGVTLVSAPPGGGPADGRSFSPSISDDGRYVAFTSFASNLVRDDTNGEADIFWADLTTGPPTLRRLGSGFDGVQPDGRSFSPSLSGDGQAVAFVSFAHNLVSGDTNDHLDAFVWDLAEGTVTRVSVGNGAEADGLTFSPSLSANGRWVAFKSEATNLVDGDTNNAADIFVHDRQTGRTTRVSVASDGTEGDAASVSPSVSADGRYVAFASFAGNLVPGDDNAVGDVFVHDRRSRTTVKVS